MAGDVAASDDRSSRSTLVALMRPYDQEGSSPITASISLMMFLGFLLLSSQVLVHLYASSVVAAAAFETARTVAAEGSRCSAAGPGGDDAPTLVRRRLGRYGLHPSLAVRCVDDGDSTTVRIQIESPARALATPVFPTRLVEIDRTATMRTERLR
ncbi:MAG: hypothetical protein WD576_00860 [Nitriliruptoraceae bacterium]